MPIWIALLRGINVGGHKKIKMADLRQLFDSLGLRDTRTVLQSGNAVFHAPETESARLKTLLENGIRDAFGVDVKVMLRTVGGICRPAFFAIPLQRRNCRRNPRSSFAFSPAQRTPARLTPWH